MYVGIPQTGHDPAAVEINNLVIALNHSRGASFRGKCQSSGVTNEVEGCHHAIVDGDVDEVSQKTTFTRNTGVGQMQGHFSSLVGHT